MRRRTKLLLIGLALATVTLFVIDRLFVVHPGITVRNARRIQVGMSLREVERLLGRSADVSTEVSRDGLLYALNVWAEGEGCALFMFVYLEFVWSNDDA